jgi:RNA 2',3'-cyclic 3'-phosphodiesterase
MAERIRCFMALLLAEPLRKAAGEVQEQMRGLFPPGAVRWVAPENFHLTVRFFGDLDRKGMEKAADVVAAMDTGFPPVRVRIRGVSAFPSPARPQTLWLSLGEDGGELERLAGDLDRRIREAGFGPADKPWKSHLTVGRAGRERALRLDPAWTAGLTWSGEESTITTIALMQSELRPQGPRYTPLRTASVSPAA